MTSRRELEALAALFTYPGNDYLEAIENAAACSRGAAPALREFAREVLAVPLETLQELYTGTFDLQPACSLDLGWHLFGEEYERGLFLARMRRELCAHGIPESHELPDHLSHALLLLAKMEPAEAEEFASVIVGAALAKMLKCLPPGNLIHSLLRSVQQTITLSFPAAFETVPSAPEGAML